MNQNVGAIEYDARIKTSNLKTDAKHVESIAKGAATNLGGEVEKGTGLASKSFLKLGVVMGAVAGIANSVVTRAMNAVSNSIGAAVKRVDTLNNFPKVMANMGIAAKDAVKASEKITKGIQGLPTSLDNASLAVQRLTTRTKNVDKSTDIFLAFNNAVLAGAAPMELQSNAMEQFAQAFSKGKPDMMEWRSMVSAMPAQLDQVAKSMKLKGGVDELGSKLRDGTISMGKFSEQIVKLNGQGVGGLPNFATQAKNATAGIGTGFTNMQTAITRSIAKVIGAIGAGNIANVITNIGKIFESSTGYVINFGKQAVALGRQVVSYLTPKVVALTNSFRDGIVPVLKELWKNLVPLSAAIGKVFVGALGAAVDILNVFVRVIAPVASFLMTNKNLVLALAASFGTLAISLKVWDAVDRLRVAFMVMKTTTIPGLIASLGSFVAMMTSPVGLAIAGVTILAGLLTARFMQQRNETDRAKEAADRLKLSYDTLKASQDRLKDSQLGLQGSTLAVERAQKNYTEAVKMYGVKSLEAREAAYNLKRAEQDLTKAHNEAKDAVNAHSKAESEYAKNGGLIQSADQKIRAMQLLKNTIGLSPGVPYRMPSGSSRSSGDPLGVLGRNAKGTDNWRGGATWVGERGPEIVNLPRGSQVIPNHRVNDAMNKGNGSTTTIGNVNISNELDGRYWLRRLTNTQDAAFSNLTPQGMSL